jgi:uncharacterized delta-60 repeat protein
MHTSRGSRRRRIWAAVAAVLALVAASGPATAEAGDRDDSFGRGGVAVVEVPCSSCSFHALDVFAYQDGTLALPGNGSIQCCDTTDWHFFDSTGTAISPRSPNFPPGMVSYLDISRAGVDGFVLTDGFGVSRTDRYGGVEAGFGGDSGGVVYPVLPGDAFIGAIAAQPDLRFQLGLSSSGGDATVMRLNTDGSTDTGFGVDGVATVDGGGQEAITQILPQPDGKTVWVGSTTINANTDLLLARFTAAGQPDPTYGNGGVRRVDLGGLDHAVGAVLRGDNRLVVAASSSGQQVLVQLTTAGVPDPQFGTNGLVRTPSLPAPSDLALLGQGRIVTAGAQAGSGPVTVARFQANGTLDPTFSGDGIATTAVYGSPSVTGVGVQPDGKVVVSLDHQTLDAAVARFTTTGGLDTAFGLDGIASELETESEETLVTNVADGGGGTFSAGWRWEPQAQAFNYPSNSLVVQHSATGRIVRSFGSGGFAEHRSVQRIAGIARQSDGRLVLAGINEEYDGADEFFTIARLNANGAPDQGFVTTGASANAFRLGVPSAATGVAVRGDGRIVAVGTRRSDGASVIVRLRPSGAPDTSFSGDGIAVFPALLQTSAIKLLSDGSILVAGSRSGDLAVLKLTATGTRDISFGRDGFATLDAGDTDRVRALQTDAAGKLVLAGDSATGAGTRAVVARMNAGGTPDLTFSADALAFINAGATTEAHGIALQANGRLVVTGTADGAVLLARITPGGAMDPAFGGGDGIVLGPSATGFGLRASGNAIRIDSMNRAIVTGAESPGDGSTAGDGLVIAYRLN